MLNVDSLIQVALSNKIWFHIDNLQAIEDYLNDSEVFTYF